MVLQLAELHYAVPTLFDMVINQHFDPIMPLSTVNEQVPTLCEVSELKAGNTGILFLTQDIETIYSELKGKGVTFTQVLTKERWGTYAIFSDPYGNEHWHIPKN